MEAVAVKQLKELCLGNTKKRILLIDDEPDLLKILSQLLLHAGYDVFTASDGKNIDEWINTVLPHLILLDVMLPGTSGIEIKEKLCNNTATAAIPVIFLTAKRDITDKVKGLNLGVDDYVTKPFDEDELLARIKAVLDRRAFYETISMTDGLTGLYNVTYFKKQFELFFNISRRYNKIFSLALVDINSLKKINDTYGHPAGDIALRTFARIAKETFREVDSVMRYAGDEFVVLMPEIHEEQANIALLRLKEQVEKSPFMLKDIHEVLRLSFSFGIVDSKDCFTLESEMFEFADQRLYEHKKRVKKEDGRS